MRDEDGVQSGCEGGIDVGTRAITNHPRYAGFAAVVVGEREVGFVVLLGQDFDSGEMRGQARATEFVGLLIGGAFGDEDEAVAGGEFGESFGNAGKELNLLVSDCLGEANDAVMLFGGDRGVAELLKTVDQRTAEAAEAVTVSFDGGVLAVVEMLADLLG